MTHPTIGQQRLYHQGISHPRFEGVAETVQWLGALQAQDYASAEWTIGLRLPGASPTTIAQAITERTLVRTWLLRGTLHIVAASDLRWMLTLLSPRLLERSAKFHRQLGLDEETVEKSCRVMAKALQDGKQLTRTELFDALARSGIEMKGLPASNLLTRAAFMGLICLGPMRGKQPTFVLLDEWLPAAESYARDEALAALALRYFTSHGPATLQDFAWWSGLLMADARFGLETIRAQLFEEKRNGKSYWRVPVGAAGANPSPNAHLLPGFDEYVLGYSDRSDIMEKEQEKRISGVNAIFSYTMVLDGRVTGTWKRTQRKGAVELQFSPFAPLSPEAAQSFAAAAKRYGDFLGLPVTLDDDSLEPRN